MPNLQDVAKKAGVSTATVSKVLSNTPYFTDETRDRVMDAVRELGYVPNLAARALSSGKTHIVAVVFPYLYDAIFKDPLVMQILEGIEAECTARQHNILLSTPRLAIDEPDTHYLQLIQSKYIDGLIAIDNLKISAAQPAIEREIPTVVIGYGDSPHRVCSDDDSGGRKLMAHVLELGHREIALISVPQGANLALGCRLDGMREVLRDAEIDLNVLPMGYGDYSTRSGAEMAAELLTRYPDITALVCLNDRMALGAVQQAYQMGRVVPDDLTVVGYDNIAAASISRPALTTIDQHASELGRRAAQMLFEVLDGNTPEPVVLPVDLVVRGSSGAVPG